MSKINVDYDVLNQKGSPAWFTDTFANIPTPGYVGRMFISTDTFAFYRDNGSGWDLVGGPGTGTITGAGVFGQVTFFSGTDTISGNTDFFWDNTNKRLGINTGTPGAPLDIHTTGIAAQFNGTGTNNAFVTFQNAGTSKWRTGNLYNSASNDYQIFDVLNSTARLTIKNTGATTIDGTLTATSLIKSGGTSNQILLADGTTTPTSTFGAGSVTSVAALTLASTGTDLSSSVANSTTTPVITLNVPTASATNRGALSSTDWSTFNNKQTTITLTTTGTSGAATLVGATLNVPNYTNVGTVTSVAALTLGTSGTDLSSSVANSTSTPVITLNVPTASASNRGALSSADWTTFNSKQATISVTAPVVLTGANISIPAATTSVNGYLTSTDWNTFNNKSNTNGTVTNVVALTIDTSGIDITSTAVTTTTTPVITLNVPTASASNRGALSSTDWTTFNNKQATLSLTTTGTSGAATLVANTLNIPQYQSALTNPVTGTGTTNYLPKFTGTSTIGNSAITDDGSSITLGLGQTTFGTTGSKFYVYPAFSTNLNLLQNYNGSAYTTEEHRASDYSFKIGTTASLTIASTGAATFSSSVSVNTTNAVSTLEIGAVESDGTGSTNAVRIQSKTSPSNQQLLIGINQTGTYSFLQSSQASVGYKSLALNPNGGNVLIGTTTDSGYKLDVNGTGRFKLASDRNLAIKYDTNITLSAQADAGAPESLRMYADTFRIYTATTAAGLTERFTIANSGAATFSSSVTAANIILNAPIDSSTLPNTPSNYLITLSPPSTTGYYGGGIGWSEGTNTAAGINAYDDGSGGALGLSFATGTNSGLSERIRITSGGVVQVVSRGNFLNATDNALFSLNSGGTLYTVGFSPTATASSTATLSLTTGTTTWIYTGSGAATWTLPNPSGNNQIYWIKNAGTGAITLTAFSGTNIINNSAVSVSTVSIGVGATAVIAQDGNVKSYQLQ